MIVFIVNRPQEKESFCVVCGSVLLSFLKMPEKCMESHCCSLVMNGLNFTAGKLRDSPAF